MPVDVTDVDTRDKILKIRAMTRHIILVMMAAGLVVGLLVASWKAETFSDNVELLKWFAGISVPFLAFLFGERGALKVPGKEDTGK